MGVIHSSLLEDKTAGDSEGPFALNTPNSSFVLQGQILPPMRAAGAPGELRAGRKAHRAVRQLAASPPRDHARFKPKERRIYTNCLFFFS